MLLNCGVGEDCWEFLGLKGDPTSQSSRKSVLNIHWKDWCWSWNSNTLAIWCEELTHWKNPDAGKDWRQEEKGTTENEMVGWHHWLDGHEFEQALGVGDGQGSLVRCSPWGRKESDTTEWTELNWRYAKAIPRDMTVNLITFYCNCCCCSVVDWFDLLAVQGTLQSLLQHNSSKASGLRCSAFFMVYCNTLVKINIFRDFPWDSRVGTQCFHCRGHGLNLWLVN